MNQYQELRDKYLPVKVRVVFVFESPPAHSGYFYDSAGSTGEILFRTIMETLDISAATKHEGLVEFANRGYLLINPIYEPVNKLPENIADAKILANFSEFLKDLNTVIANRNEVYLILVKKNICRLLEDRLLKHGFHVLNKGARIPFPMHFHKAEFMQQVRSLLARSD